MQAISDHQIMSEISAAKASKRFADMLDAVEHRGETFTVVRRGRAIARSLPPTEQRSVSCATSSARIVLIRSGSTTCRTCVDSSGQLPRPIRGATD